MNLVSYQCFDKCEEVRMKLASPSTFIVCRAFDLLDEFLTTCVAIAPELASRSSCEHLEVEALNETCQSRASSDHLPPEPQASTPSERITFRSGKVSTRQSIR